ncbi:protein-glutamate methylesterase/protein-glutamine glutaminase [Salisediminibacterium selenitireducens]|uniref:Protein-glutamate methylesterase/protein-glutamine glutaminase n=1 Tax=Bacillus selenitireducens (strain ATCC 700615 / DSM 15326 / MLS10) TaxID=439292 RepID=D6XTY5_BACIE|nr:chemotaxis response regulator protein-glutamate methylesterase [Salisediminibacterium selenitireducens]ADH99271.1 response regulator receiver modulated CheB methylesterase [[Bacillus] selenitireducens MLS10]
MIKVLVVDDSAFMRKMLSDMLSSHPDITVVDKARNGRDGLEKIEQHKPDVVTLDVEMPVMTGIEALEEIMKTTRTPAIMVSSVTKEGAETTMRAMELGAFDFIAKPSGAISLDIDKVKDDLIEKVLHASKVSRKKLTPAPKRTDEKPKRIERIQRPDFSLEPGPSGKREVLGKTIVAIGTSTGGPKALQRVLTALPENFPFPIIIVQHMPKGFTRSLSERLNSLSAISVKEAEEGDILKKGVAYIAPGGYHLKVRRAGTSVGIHLDQSPLVNGHRPSVDAMFFSLADLHPERVIAVVMTGMGSDGKQGLIRLKQLSKTKAIAESERTSVVFGMPKAAIDTHFVDSVKDLEDISSEILRYC